MVDRIAILTIMLASHAAPALPAETRSAVQGEPRPAAAVAELGWLAGSWVGEGIAGRARETYSPVIGNAIVGHFSQQRGDDVWFYELLAIRQDGASLTYCLKHFNADLTGWEAQHEVQCFPLVARADDAYYFDGLTIRRVGRNGMIAGVRVADTHGTREHVIRYRREGASAD